MIRQLLFLVCVVTAGASAAFAATAEPSGKVVARIGKLTVTDQDVQRELQRRLPMQVSFHGGVKPEKLEQITAEAREAVILRAYKLQYALDSEIAVDAATVEKEWQAMLKKNPRLGQATEQQKSAERADLYLGLLAKKAEDVAVDRKVVVTDDEVKTYYQANKEKFFQPKLYKASHVFIKVDPADSAEEKELKKKKAEKIFERAKAGEDFYNLAYYESDDRTKYVGGSLGSFHAGQTIKEFDDVVQAMKVGDIRGPVKTLYGYHVIRMDEVQEARQLSYEEAADKIRKMYTDQRRKQLYEAWIDTLHAKYPLQQ